MVKEELILFYLNLEFSLTEKCIQSWFECFRELAISKEVPWNTTGTPWFLGTPVKNTTERHFVSYDVCDFDDQVFQLYFSVLKKYLSSSLELCGPGVDVTVWCVHV